LPWNSLRAVRAAGQALAKFSLDSTIQHDVLHAHLGLWVACVVLAAWAFLVIAGRRPAETQSS